jgi:hypothetical protein
MKKQYWGGTGIGATLAALSMAVACGDTFGGEPDCKVNRTCADGGSDNGGPGGSGGSDGGTPSDAVGGATAGDDGTGDGGTTTLGGEAGAAGAAGASDGGCRAAADCSNGDPADGEEVCNAGACSAGNPPPTVVTVSPKDASADVELDAKIAIKFSEPLDAKSVTPATIRVLDGKTVVPGSLDYANNTVTFTPTSPLALLAPYTVSVTTGVKDKDGAPLLSEYASEFSTRDGAWKTVDVASGDAWRLSAGVPISSEGDVLVAWAGGNERNCPITARWFRRGVAATTTVFDLATPGDDCSGVSASGNAAGVASVVWKIGTAAHGTYVQQYRAGAWQTNPPPVSKDISGHDFHLAVAPSGVATLFEHVDTGTYTWKTDAEGKWPTTGDRVSYGGAFGPVSVAYDAEGNALAVWHSAATGTSIERIVASRFDAPTGHWSAGADLPGSVAATAPTVDHLRGIPVVAMDDKGNAMALWVDGSADGKLMASRYSRATGWEAPELISGTLLVESRYEPPALVFDGQVFVAAWTAQEGGKRYTFTARYDAAKGWGAAARQQVAAADGTSALKMPRLASDGRGNLLLVFAKGAAPTYSLVYQRYAQGAWQSLKAVPGGTVSYQYFEARDSVLALSMNASGLAALSWGNYDQDGQRLSGIRLASFY